MEIKNNPITLFLTNLLTFRFYCKFFYIHIYFIIFIQSILFSFFPLSSSSSVNRDPKSETEPFLSSNNPNDEPEEDPCENWVSSRCYYDFLIPSKPKKKKKVINSPKQLSYIKYKELKQKKLLHLDFLKEGFCDKADYDVHSIIRQLRYEQEMKKYKDDRCDGEKDEVNIVIMEDI
ncbi:hypothetical protein GLOIN_2v386794 [Rhizophagus irregularis DAOM 181602=DAOM 197198]|uniref:Uncharacterized protein n=1 Tax=Rhizophagus irregularis (strain DAOM 181602 / DAOM 197198 / MUCL 43194) TaxID=747089 RepID=A0A2P4QQX8_RHIID|nr:hypothetical protein GLOIN_2v386794 [Rhizophagus irregularis DAOM 181602=DAOM 197198]POG80059.1 hypothetical protein GLOIN_2v386794 [Rhizophagus irregularis DAOM 181602=DAOM 197198]|eukprot:XP_025186925.1 hypothetical protein GLOIN_2v386794 [Rhizophagus irregularis DAOM 181602=DAOM 197198]